jgi:ABC-type multidrug transport system ATPase subunit
MAAIEILGLEKTYMVGFWRKRPKRALQPLHLTVEEGEIFGFLGPNGAGKTTTFSAAEAAHSNRGSQRRG